LNKGLNIFVLYRNKEKSTKQLAWLCVALPNEVRKRKTILNRLLRNKWNWNNGWKQRWLVQTRNNGKGEDSIKNTAKANSAKILYITDTPALRYGFEC